MEAYPGELLVGVFPLVFCVDATSTSSAASTTDGSNSKAPESPSHRSQFDRFLDAVSMVEEGEEHPLAVEGSAATSLFRGDEDEDSDDEDEFFMSSPSPSVDSDDILSSTGPGPKGKKQRNTSTKRSLNMANFRLGGRNSSNITVANPTASNIFGGSVKETNAIPHPPPPMNTSYANALQQGQGFFQRARIVSISTRHGFPPSKDSTGDESNRIAQFINPKTSSIEPTKLLHSLNHRPIDGILTSGWLEKHAGALPSVLMVVVAVTGNSDASAATSSDKKLLETLESLQMQLAPKRECQVHVVGLVQEGVSMIHAEQWSQTLSEELYGQNTHITLLNVEYLSSEEAPSQALQHLHRSVRNASLTYYLNQARRTKSKLAQLGHARHSPLLLPLAIRYCFKVAMFYEFQWKHEKSLKFMAEAYRHVEQYYRYLLQKREEELSDDPVSPSRRKPARDPIRIVSGSTTTTSTSEETETEGVELALRTPQKENAFDEIAERAPPTSPDMLHQCRAVADWLNFKILHAGFVSHTEGGLLAASSQWQKHAQAFTSIRSFITASSDNIWHDWMYVANQRVVVSQLLERHPPKALGDLGNEFDEVLLRCSPWRTYEAAAEALLQLGLHVKRAMTSSSSPAPGGKIDDLCGRYVGGLSNDGLAPILQEEFKKNHREKALDCVSRAISLFERDLEKAKAKDDEEHVRERSWSRSGARMYYLAGGILSGLERHAEAIPYLQKAVNYSKGWNGLELVIRRMLIECYEKHIPTQSEDAASESNQIVASMILDSYFNAEMSNSNLRKALEKFSTLRAGEIKWYRDCLDEADSSLPFSFALTFPSATHATAGDAVKASVLIKSNLDYAVHINSVTLLSSAGKISIPSGDLLSAKNANEGSDGGIIIQAHTEILISTQLELPKDLNQIAIDETGNGGEKEGVAGKGSFAKSARPRTSGITAAAGGRLIAENVFVDESRPSNAQWSLRCLGGKSVRCDGIQFVFYPVYASATSEGKMCEIELTIEKKQPKTQANIKRTPFEEDNYVASAWMRPRHLPMNRGPRCLRVLPSMADLIVTNLTESYTNGKVLEGTVNRILLKLKAGAEENCTDVTFRVSCSSFLITIDGNTKRIVSEDSDDSEKTTEKMDNPAVRTPVLVKRDQSAPAMTTEYGYELPAGWVLVGDGQGIRDRYSSVVSTLRSGDSTFAYFDLYRPSPKMTRMDGVLQVGEQEEDFACERDMCQTDVDVSVSYRQERSAKQVKKSRRRARKKPALSGLTPESDTGDGEEAKAEEDTPDLVTLDYTASVMWNAPIAAAFYPGIKETHPCGNRHPSNTVPDPEAGKLPPDVVETEMVLIDGERVNTKCSLEAVASSDGLTAEIERIRFENNIGEHVPCTFKLLSGKASSGEGLLYQADEQDPCRKLQAGSKFSLAWTTEVKMKNDYLKGSVSTSLGVVSVDWIPTPLELPKEVTAGGSIDSVDAHGPLSLTTPCTCRFMGPPCYIENAPFETIVEGLPSSPRVAVPFDVTYRIKNKTSIDQKLKVFLKNSAPESQDSDGFLVSGLVNGEVSLGPLESHTLSYIILATRTGTIPMPNLCISSDRYNTWIVDDSTSRRRSVFVLP